MPDVPFPKPTPPSRRDTVTSRVAESLDRLSRFVRLSVTGSEKGSIRRSSLFVIAISGIGIAMATGGPVAPLLAALLAVLLLALTDQVVEL